MWVISLSSNAKLSPILFPPEKPKLVSDLSIVLSISTISLENEIIKLNELIARLKQINIGNLTQTQLNDLTNLFSPLGTNQFPPYKGFNFKIKEEQNQAFIVKGNKRRYAVAIDSNNVDNQNVIIETKQSSKKIQYFTPSQSNSLFWCFYIIYNGFSSYEYESNYFTAEQQFKFQTIEKVKKGDNKTVFKENKISKTNFESGLMGNTNITAKTLYALCLCYNVNIFYVYKNTYYEMITNTDTPVYIIKYNTETNNYSIYMPVDTQIKETPTEHKEYIENIKQKYWKLDNLEKPLRPITIYSVNDLVNICSKLDIDIICEKTKKRKTKAELYSSILQSL